jgi:hypothetical protein
VGQVVSAAERPAGPSQSRPDRATGSSSGDGSFGVTDPKEAEVLRTPAEEVRQTVTEARDNPEEALANLLTALETLGLITDSTTAT